MTGQPRKCLQIIVEDSDRHGGEPLHEAIVRYFYKNGIVGATVSAGIIGYGVHHRIHRKGIFGVSEERPIVITAVDTEDNLRKVLPTISSMVKEGVVFLSDVEVFPHTR